MSGSTRDLVLPQRLAANTFGMLGRYLLTQFHAVGLWAGLWLRTTRYVLAGALDRSRIIRQIESIGIGSLPLAALTVVFSTMVLAIHTVGQFIDFGFADKIGYLISASVVREAAPVLVAIMVAAREGSAIAAELASMKITEQIDALRSLATDPVQYLVVPRYVAMLVAMPLLTVISGTAGVFGGWLVAAAHRVPHDIYWNAAARGVTTEDLVSGAVKSLVFGAIVAIVSCHQGLNAGHGAEAVGRATTASVVLCVVLVHAADFALVLVFGG